MNVIEGIVFISLLAVEVFYYFVYPMIKDKKKDEKEILKMKIELEQLKNKNKEE